MNTTRVFRPLTRALQRQPAMLAARPTVAAAQLKTQKTEAAPKPVQSLVRYKTRLEGKGEKGRTAG
jgi:hypothetical protein